MFSINPKYESVRKFGRGFCENSRYANGSKNTQKLRQPTSPQPRSRLTA